MYLYKSLGVTRINVKSNGKHTSETERVIPKDSVHDSNSHHPVTWSSGWVHDVEKRKEKKVWGSQESLKDSLVMKDSMPECYHSVWGSRGKNQRSQNNFESLIFFLRRRIHSGKDPSHVADPRSVECFREIMARNVPAVNRAICWAVVVKYWNAQHTNIDIYPQLGLNLELGKCFDTLCCTVHRRLIIIAIYIFAENRLNCNKLNSV